MKKCSLTLLFTISLFALFSGCGDSKNHNSGEGHATRSYDTTDSAGIRSIALDISVKTAHRYYNVIERDDSCSLSLSVAVDWPEKVGDYNILRLQQAILSEISGEKTAASVTEAISGFIGDTERFGIGDNISRVDKAPPVSPFAYEVSTDVKFMALEGDLITYNVTNYSYLGGAHGLNIRTPFSFDLSQGRIVDMKWLFTGDYEKVLTPLLEDSVADKADMSVQMLRKSMLVPAFVIASNVYIQGGFIVFHYNPYEILPYSYGSIDVSVSPYLIREILTPQAQQALL